MLYLPSPNSSHTKSQYILYDKNIMTVSKFSVKIKAPPMWRGFKHIIFKTIMPRHILQ